MFQPPSPHETRLAMVLATSTFKAIPRCQRPVVARETKLAGVREVLISKLVDWMPAVQVTSEAYIKHWKEVQDGACDFRDTLEGSK